MSIVNKPAKSNVCVRPLLLIVSNFYLDTISSQAKHKTITNDDTVDINKHKIASVK